MGKRIPPETKAAMLADLKAGKGCDEVAVTHGVGRQTVYTLREKHRDDLPAWKRRTAAGLMEAAGKLVNRLNDEVGTKDASIKDQSIAAGILIDKASMLRDQPAAIVEHRHEIGQGLGGWLGQSMHQSAPQAEKTANVVEIESISEQGGGSGEQRTCDPDEKARADGHARHSTRAQGAGGVENCAPSPPNMD